MGPVLYLAIGIVTLSEGVALACAIGLWRGSDPIGQRLLWTAVLSVPVLGPFFFGALHRRVVPSCDVPDNPGFDLSRFDPTDTQPPDR